MKNGLMGRLLGVFLGVLLGLVLAVVAGPYVARMLGGPRAPQRNYVIGGGF